MMALVQPQPGNLSKKLVTKNIVSRKRMNIDLGGTAVNDIKIIGVSEVNFSFILSLLCFLYISWYGSIVFKISKNH